MGWHATWRQVPPPIRFALAQAATGFAVAGFAVAGIFAADFNGLGTLLARAEAHPWPVLLLWFFLGTSFSAVQIGIAVMRLGQCEAEPPPRPRLAEARLRRRVR
jgi:hypothetical protein